MVGKKTLDTEDHTYARGRQGSTLGRVNVSVAAVEWRNNTLKRRLALKQVTAP